MSPQNINVLPIVEQIKQLTEQGWQLSVSLSGTHGRKPELFGITARMDLIGGYCEMQVRATTKRETLESVADDLVLLCSGFKVRQVGT